MALSRKFLASKGIEADVIEEIITAHTETISGLKDKLDEANGYKEKAEKYDSAKKELDDLKAEVAKNSDKDYDKLKKEFDDYKAEVSAKETKTAKETAYRKLCKDAKLSEEGITKAVKYAEWDKIELDEKGEVKNPKDHLKAIGDEWGKFIETTGQQGASTSTPPAGGGDNKPEKSEAAQRAAQYYAARYGAAETK